MAEVGRFEYLSVTADNDIRLKEHGLPTMSLMSHLLDWVKDAFTPGFAPDNVR